MIDKIIINKSIQITPSYIYKLILIFGLICFISGLIGGYILNIHLMYNQFYDLINNHGILIFDDKYYKFIEIYPKI